MNLKEILESWKKYRLIQQGTNIANYLVPRGNDDITNQSRYIKDIGNKRLARKPFNPAEGKSDYLRKAFRGSVMANEPFDPTNKTSVESGILNFHKGAEAAWSQLDLPERRRDRVNKILRILNRKRNRRK